MAGSTLALCALVRDCPSSGEQRPRFLARHWATLPRDFFHSASPETVSVLPSPEGEGLFR